MSERDLFLAAIDRPDPARAAYLEEACAGDVALRARVEDLLRSHDTAGSFLGRPAVASSEPESAETKAFVSEGVPRRDSDEELRGFLTPSLRPDGLGRLGHYEVLQILGKGGFGIVVRAFDDVLQRVVAVKVMAPHLAATSPARKRFLREARSSAAVRHENVVQVYEVAEHPLPYLAMEFIPGETLQQKLARNGPLEVSEVLRIGRQIAEGLAAAHAMDLIHRDIKPANVLIESGQHRVKITDFGLARAADDASISQSGIIAGTPMYMAPEQAKGEKLDQRADLFSLGSVLYQMASGRAPFRANGTLAVLKRVADDTPRAIREIVPEVPRWLCDIISKLHVKNPDERYQSAREVADVLADCETQLKAHGALRDFSKIPGGKPRAFRSRVGKRIAVSGVGVVAVAGLVAVIAGPFFWSPQPKPDRNPIVAAQTETPPASQEGFVPLFNGRDLTGWKTHPDRREGWRVEDGAIVGSGGRCHLFTDRGDYGDHVLRAECRVGAGGEGGIFLRCEFGFGRSRWGGQWTEPQGYEIGIDEGNPDYRTGSLYGPDNAPAALRAVWENLVEADRWFPIEIACTGNRITTRVGGKTLYEFTDPRELYSRGHIALEVGDRKAVIRYRHIEIKEY